MVRILPRREQAPCDRPGGPSPRRHRWRTRSRSHRPQIQISRARWKTDRPGSPHGHRKRQRSTRRHRGDEIRFLHLTARERSQRLLSSHRLPRLARQASPRDTQEHQSCDEQRFHLAGQRKRPAGSGASLPRHARLIHDGSLLLSRPNRATIQRTLSLCRL